MNDEQTPEQRVGSNDLLGALLHCSFCNASEGDCKWLIEGASAYMLFLFLCLPHFVAAQRHGKNHCRKGRRSLSETSH